MKESAGMTQATLLKRRVNSFNTKSIIAKYDDILNSYFLVSIERMFVISRHVTLICCL